MERFNAGDIDGLVALYEEDAIFVPEPGGKPLVGRDAIRDFAVNFPIEDAPSSSGPGPFSSGTRTHSATRIGRSGAPVPRVRQRWRARRLSSCAGRTMARG